MHAPLALPRRRHGGICRLIFLLLFVAAVAAVIFWFTGLKGYVLGRISQTTGFPASAEKLSLNPFAGTLTLVGFKLENPEGFQERTFLDLPGLDVDVDLRSLPGDGQLVIPRLAVDLARVAVVTDAEKRRNIDLLRENLEKAAGPAADEPKKDSAKPPRPFIIKELHLKVGTLMYADYSARMPEIRSFPIDIDQRLTDVTSAEDIARQVASSPRFLSLVNSFADPGFLERASERLGDAARTAKEKAAEAGKAAAEAARETAGAVSAGVKELIRDVSRDRKDAEPTPPASPEKP